jgi:hypothetical protein
MIGVGEEQNIEKIIKNYLKLLFQKLLNTRVHIFLIFPHLPSMELEIMELSEAEILIFGQSGLVELNFNHISQT